MGPRRTLSRGQGGTTRARSKTENGGSVCFIHVPRTALTSACRHNKATRAKILDGENWYVEVKGHINWTAEERWEE